MMVPLSILVVVLCQHFFSEALIVLPGPQMFKLNTNKLSYNVSNLTRQVEELDTRVQSNTDLILDHKAFLEDQATTTDELRRETTEGAKSTDDRLSVLEENLLQVKNSLEKNEGGLIKHEDWILVFRAQADVGISVYDTWMDDLIYHDNPVLQWLQPDCLTLKASSKPCKLHFKSRIVPMWEYANIEKVKVLLLKNGEVAAETVFDGTDSSKTSWFSQDRVLNSKWTDLKSSQTNFFSVEGDSEINRRFFMNSLYKGCPGDLGWMAVTDGYAGVIGCTWDNLDSFPKFYYSKMSTKGKPSDTSDFGYADVMAILVQTSA